MSLILFKWIKRLITLTIVFASLYYFYQYKEEFYLINEVSPLLLLALSLLTILSITINGNKLRLITESFKIKLNSQEWLGLAFVSSFFNGVIYKSGSLFTSNYLKGKYNLSYASFIGALGADHLMMILINAFIGLGVSIYVITHPIKILAVSFLFLGLVIGIFHLARNPPPKLKSKNQFLFAFVRAIDTFHKILTNKFLFKILFFNNLFLATVMGLRLYVACKAIGINFGILDCYIFTTASAFVRLIPMLQSDIGSRELTVGFLSESLGAGFKQGVLATAADRVFEMTWGFIGLTVFRNLLINYLGLPKEKIKPN